MIILLLIQYFSQRPLSRKNMHFLDKDLWPKYLIKSKIILFPIEYKWIL